MKEIFLSVVIPCYDEMANLQKGVLDKVLHFLSKKGYSYEVIVSDDGSQDGSLAFVEKFTQENENICLLKNQHLGKVGAVTNGMLAAKGKYVLFTDMDQATPIEEVDKLLPYFEKGYDVVIGSRKEARKGSPWTRQIVSWGMRVLRRIVVGLPGIIDTQCGFKAFSANASKKLFTKMSELHNGFTTISGSAVTAGFDVELLFLALKYKYKIKEVGVEWLYVESRRVNPIQDSIDAIVYLLKIRYNHIVGKY